MYCKHCGAEMNEGQEVCIKCGMSKKTKVNGETAYCTNCGKPINPSAAVCVACGFSQGNKSNGSSGANVSGGLKRSSDQKIITGVCGGLGENFGVSPWIFRLLFIIFGFWFIGLIVYIGLAVIMKPE